MFWYLFQKVHSWCGAKSHKIKFAILYSMSKADERHDISIEQYLSSIDDEEVLKDARIIYDMMHRVSGEEPILYGIGTIGFGVYKYAYESGRKGEAHTLGFYPRKGKTTIYLMDGTKRYEELLKKLGKYTSTGYCIYIKRLSDIDISVLEQILTESYKNITEKSQAGAITKILWQS